MAGLKIFGGPDGAAPKKQKFADDIVGRFRSGYQANKRPVALSEWRVTTGDPEVADAIARLLDGDEPQPWDASGEDNLEVFTKAPEVDIIIDPQRGLRQSLILWGRNGKIIRKTDGETILYPEDQQGEPDPDAGKSLAERKQLARDGVGPEPQIELYFRLADDPDLGLFKFQSGSWSMVSDLAYHGVPEALEDADGPQLATLRIEEVSFVAKNGPRAGQTVTYNKPFLELKGDA